MERFSEIEGNLSSFVFISAAIHSATNHGIHRSSYSDILPAYTPTVLKITLIFSAA